MSQRKHGESQSRTPEYQAWAHLLGRCFNPKDRAYSKYGGRGITVSDEWRYSYETFLKDMGRRPSPTFSIERVNNDGPYSASNCKWATSKEQARNRSSNLHILFGGTPRTLKEVAEICGVNYHLLYEHAILRGKAIDAALDATRNPKHGRLVEAFGESKSVYAWAKEIGLAPQTINSRLRRGLSAERALSASVQNRRPAA